MMTLRKKARLADALLDRYPDVVVTGYIVDARVVAGCIVGIAYKAWSYADGEWLVSGEITVISQLASGRWLIKTRDHDCFVIVNFTRGGLQALLHLIDLFETAQLARSSWCLH